MSVPFLYATTLTCVGLQRLDDLGRPRAGVHALVPLLDLAVPVDDHPDPGRTLLGVDVGAVGGADRPVGVADEREVEVELLGEGLVLGRAVEGRAEDDGVLAVVVGLQVAEPATLGGSARRVGLGVEPEHDRLAPVVRQLHGVAVVITPGELGCLVSWSQHARSLSRAGGTWCGVPALRSSCDGPTGTSRRRPAGRQPLRTISAAKASSASQSYGPLRNAMLSRVQPSARNSSTIVRASFTVPRR
jgi:hypothetical protein